MEGDAPAVYGELGRQLIRAARVNKRIAKHESRANERSRWQPLVGQSTSAIAVLMRNNGNVGGPR